MGRAEPCSGGHYVLLGVQVDVILTSRPKCGKRQALFLFMGAAAKAHLVELWLIVALGSPRAASPGLLVACGASPWARAPAGTHAGAYARQHALEHAGAPLREPRGGLAAGLLRLRGAGQDMGRGGGPMTRRGRGRGGGSRALVTGGGRLQHLGKSKDDVLEWVRQRRRKQVMRNQRRHREEIRDRKQLAKQSGILTAIALSARLNDEDAAADDERVAAALAEYDRQKRTNKTAAFAALERKLWIPPRVRDPTGFSDPVLPMTFDFVDTPGHPASLSLFNPSLARSLAPRDPPSSLFFAPMTLTLLTRQRPAKSDVPHERALGRAPAAAACTTSCILRQRIAWQSACAAIGTSPAARRTQRPIGTR